MKDAIIKLIEAWNKAHPKNTVIVISKEMHEFYEKNYLLGEAYREEGYETIPDEVAALYDLKVKEAGLPQDKAVA